VLLFIVSKQGKKVKNEAVPNIGSNPFHSCFGGIANLVA
jgi:hypothetical protein